MLARSPDLIPALRPNDLCSAAFFGDMARVKELLFVEPVDDDPPLEPADAFDPLAPGGDDDDAAAAAEAQERAAQRAANEDEVKRRLTAAGLVVSRRTAVDAVTCGLALEVLPAAPAPGAPCERVAARIVPSADAHALAHAAPALHWACLGREHEIVALLIASGADPDAATPATFGVSARQLCVLNGFLETARVVAVASAARGKAQLAAQAARDERAAELERRRALRDEAARKQALADDAAADDATAGAGIDDGDAGADGADDAYDDGGDDS